MKNQSSNPNQDSTSSPPPPSPPPPTPEPQVVSEDPAENGNADPKSPPADVAEDPAVNAPVQEVTARFEVGSAAMTAEAMGHVMLSAMNGGSGNNLRVKLPIKRKSVAIVSDSSGKPQTCRVCSQRFPTWRVMYQHVMEIHLTAPPPPPPQPQPVIHRQGGNGFDLNLNEAVESDELVLQIAPPAAPTGHENKKEQAASSSSSSSSSSSAAPAHDDVAPEKVKFPFDLNELPPDEDDDDDTAALN